MYNPNNSDTSGIKLPDELLALTEKLAEHVHDCWARQRLNEGWVYGPLRDDVAKTMPGLVPYDELSESEKEYDRITAAETVKFIISNGFSVKPDNGGR